MSIKLKTSGGWKNLASVKLKTSSGWKNVSKAFLRTSAGWKIIFGTTTVGPQIDEIPTISAGSWSVSSNIGRFVLTGTNGTWTYGGGGTISQSYQFQYSTDNSNWIDLGSSGSISNGQTKTLTVYQSDYVAATQYYRFSVSATANVNNSINEEHSDATSVTIPSPNSITGGYVSAISSGTGSLSPTVGTVESASGIGQFTFSWSSLTNVSSLVVSWTPSDTSPTSPQTYYSSGSITPTKTVSSTTSVSGSLTAYGYAGSGGSFSAGWNTSAYANQYNISYSINGGTTQNTTSTGNSISLGSGSSGDSISVTITPYNTASGYSGTAFTGSGTIPSQTVPSATYQFPNASITPLGTVIPIAGGGAEMTYSGGTLYVTAGTWSNSPTQYRYVWQRTDIGGQPTITHTTSSSTDSYVPSSTSTGTMYSCTITASNSYGFSTTSNSASYEFVYVPPAVPSGGSVTLTGTGAANTSITADTSGWSNSPTSYSVGIYASTGTPSPGAIGTVLKATNSPSSSSSVSYTVTTSDATSPAYKFMAYATATNAGGTSTQVSSNMITSYIPTPVYYAPPTYYAAPIYYAPPSYYAAPVYYAPPSYYAAPVYYAPPYGARYCTTFNSERYGCVPFTDCASAYSGPVC